MTINNEVQRQFGSVAERYVNSATHAHGVDLVALIDAADLRGTERAIDLGTAVGHTAFALSARAASVVGVDITDEMLTIARRLATERQVTNVRLVRASAEHLPFDDASFDLVTSRYSAHHYGQPALVAREVARLLRPGGRFILADTIAPDDLSLDTFINAVELLRDRSHVRDHTIRQWQTMLSSVGLTSDVVLEWDIQQNFEDWVTRAQTPEPAVAMLRVLLSEATDAARDMYQIRAGGALRFCLKCVMIRATKG